MTEPTPLDAVTADDLLLDRLAARLGSDHDDQLATMLLAAARQCDTALRPHQRSGRRRLGGRRTLTALAALGIAASGAGVAAAGEKSPPASAGGTVHSRVVEARPPAAGSGARVVLPRPQGPGATASLMPVGVAWVAVGPSASPSTVLVPAASPGDTSGGSGPSSATPQAVQRQQNAPVVEAQTVAAPVSQAHAVESPAVQRQVVDPFGVQFQIVAPAAARPPTQSAPPATREPPTRSAPPAAAQPPTQSAPPATREPPTQSAPPATGQPPTQSAPSAAARPSTQSAPPTAARPPTRSAPVVPTPQKDRAVAPGGGGPGAVAPGAVAPGGVAPGGGGTAGGTGNFGNGGPASQPAHPTPVPTGGRSTDAPSSTAGTARGAPVPDAAHQSEQAGSARSASRPTGVSTAARAGEDAGRSLHPLTGEPAGAVVL